MPRTALTVTDLLLDSVTVQPAGNAVDPANGHVVANPFMGDRNFSLDIDSTFAGAKTFTIKAGGAGQGRFYGDLVVSLNAQRALVGPLSADRFAQPDGSILIDVQAAATGTIRAYRDQRD